MSSQLYSKEFMDNINRKNHFSTKLAAPGNFVDNRNLAKLVYNRRNNSSDIRKEKIGKEINDLQQINYLDNNDNDALLSKLITQVPKNGNTNSIKNNLRPNTGAINQEPKTSNDGSLNSPRPNTERVSYSMSPNRLKNLSFNKLLPSKSKENINKKTLVLDLDETLVHSAFKRFERGSDLILKIELEGRYHDIHVLVRPGVDEFLEKMSKHYELIVFTASLSKYAEPLVDRLDPKGVCCFRLFREHCTMINGAFVKDLKRLDRELKDVIILDNSPISYALNTENGFPIKSWYEDKSDRELLNIIPILEFLASVNDVRDFIKKMVDRNEISYNKSFNLMSAYKKEAENNLVLNMNNVQVTPKIESSIKNSPINVSNQYLNHNVYNNNSSGRTTPKYSSNFLNKKETLTSINNIKLLNPNTISPPNANNENFLNENIDSKGNISIKFINNNINHFIINNNPNATADSIINPKLNPNFNGINVNNSVNNLNNQNKENQKPKNKKKLNSFRNISKPQTALSNQFVSNPAKDIKTNLMNKLASGNIGNNNQNNSNSVNKNIKLHENLDQFYIKSPSTSNNMNSPNINNLDNIIVNYSQPFHSGIYNKFNIKQLNINNEEYTPVNKATRGSISLHSTINKSSTYSSSLRFSKENINSINNNYSRPSSASNKNKTPVIRDKSSNSMKDSYNANSNPSIISTIKRTSSTNSLVKNLTRNYSKQAVSQDKSHPKAFLNINRQNPKTLTGSLDLNKNNESVKNSINAATLNGLEKNKNSGKILNPNNLHIKAPTLNSIVDSEFMKRGYSFSSRSLNPQIRYKAFSQNEINNQQMNNITPNNRYTPVAIIRSTSLGKKEKY